jgi:cytidine deaminase
MDEKTIIKLLYDKKKEALALYSKFKVSSILITKDDQMFSGVNIESSSYGLTICAERVALFKALSEGYRKFREIHIMSDLKEPCPPCGACRQVLMDFAPEIKVVMHTVEGQKKESSLDELLPYAFRKENLK